MSIELPNFKREDGWWENADAASLHEANYEAAGFVRVDQPERGDMIVMGVGRTAHPNRAMQCYLAKSQIRSGLGPFCCTTCTGGRRRSSSSAASGSTEHA
ncbi:hypothetical protein BLL42_01710 [Pseudomonas frederiksbergensis]|uniref:Uncharacterized protein n=1 Tax=Pseudomonas frederiksbergensis TaxID=104087 RepID=A0A1J0EF43_9PSED|nr:hypothetical protein BLL42_01710 [Pseudomonas frederiksbergensis]